MRERFEGNFTSKFPGFDQLEREIVEARAIEFRREQDAKAARSIDVRTAPGVVKADARLKREIPQGGVAIYRKPGA